MQIQKLGLQFNIISKNNRLLFVDRVTNLRLFLHKTKSKELNSFNVTVLSRRHNITFQFLLWSIYLLYSYSQLIKVPLQRPHIMFTSQFCLFVLILWTVLFPVDFIFLITYYFFCYNCTIPIFMDIAQSCVTL